MSKAWVISAIALLCLSTAANAASYNFDYLYDGATLSLAGGSDTPDGTSLADGDSFTLTVSAAGNDYWEVTSALVNAFVPLSFRVAEGGDRWGDINTTWNLDGSAVDSMSESSVSQQYFHIGAQSWSLASGLQFDQVVIDYTLVKATQMDSGFGGPSQTTTIDQSFSDFILQDSHTFFDGGPTNGAIDYVSAVPLPAGMTLYGSLLLAGAFVGSRRRRKA